MIDRFRDRPDAGRYLAERLKHYASRPNLLVLALPRGGVPVGYEIAVRLSAPLDVFVVRKLGVPGHEEFAMGAIASGEIIFLNHDVVGSLGISKSDIDRVIARERVELERREQLYGKHYTGIRGRTVILVDDGLATGATMRAAVMAVRQQEPAHLIVAVPVGSASTCSELEDAADEVVCAMTPEPFFAVGQWYEDFSQTTDQEVRDLLERAAHHPGVVAGLPPGRF